MIADIFVGIVLVISGCINLLAIGGFWMTPSLRTTANRFVINLLLINFISCLILSPFAFSVSTDPPTSIASLNATTFNQTESPIIETIENFSMQKYQCWSLDFVVALSVLAVMLVVMDTFVAVTDPLRYHARISDCKAWFLIAFCWVLGISFGVASVLRSHESHALSTQIDDKNVYNMLFLVTYFLLIIIAPFLLVILMYWRIYSEARESGQRMRQNGSSPLLQSALNLAATATQHQSTILTNPQCLLLVTSSPQASNKLNKQTDNGSFSADGLTMKIDKQDYYGVNSNNNHLAYVNNGAFGDTKTFLLSSPPHELMPMLSTIDEMETAPKSQQHQNILLTLTTASCDLTLKRNHSAKQLVTDASLYDDVELRQVRSTPNLQKTFDSSSELTSHREQSLELPSIQASPKALRYMTSLRHRLSNASSLFKYREEGRAARISILGELKICRQRLTQWGFHLIKGVLF
jgi:hypothetical protein